MRLFHVYMHFQLFLSAFHAHQNPQNNEYTRMRAIAAGDVAARKCCTSIADVSRNKLGVAMARFPPDMMVQGFLEHSTAVCRFFPTYEDLEETND